MKRRMKIQNGMRCPERPPGKFLTGSQVDFLLAVCNALCGIKVVEGEAPDARISDYNLIITVPRRRAAQTGGGSITIKVNDVETANQELLNLLNGNGVTITANGFGGVTINGVQLKTDGTNNAIQTILNLIAGNGITLTDEEDGGVTIDGLLLQVEGEDNDDQTILNLIGGAGVTVEDEGEGDVKISATAAAVQRYKITEVNSNSVKAKTWDGTTLGSTEVTVAKQPNARESITSLHFSGKTFTIAYSSNERTLTSDDTEFTETLIPGYEEDEEIFAITPEGGTGVTGANLLEISPARHWKTNLVEITYLDDDCETEKKRYVAATEEEDAEE